ncbi:putative sieve element occlusion [Lupinus albus]|uniref:Putative sieve element occlusion n=1 Tax=Lupinus albus TaxID=3870 RepID=A0A6A4Q392_LUPAL|nr:putative sieve element occlusion [Lupinus albus]
MTVSAMNLMNNKLVSISNMQDDILMKKLLLSHDPDGRWLDSEKMLHAVGNIMFHVSTIGVASNLYTASFPNNDITDEIQVLGCPEPIRCIIKQISCKILCKCCGEGDVKSRIMSLFDLIGNYRWDAKVVLVLAAFATSYGEFWNLTQLYPCDTLAASIMRLKQLPYKLRVLKPQIKALSLLVKTMMDVAMCIIKFESMPLQHVELGNDVLIVTKSLIYLSVYWIIRSTLACFSQVAEFSTKKHEQLSSLANRLSNIYSILKQQVDVCQQEIERNLHDKLLSLVDEVQTDNQKVLNLLFASNNYLSLKDCPTQVKLGVSELKKKIVLLLISKPQLFSVEELLLLAQQTSDHHLSESYKIVWVPLPSSDTSWTDAEDSSFSFLSDSLPWYAIWKPRSLNSAVVNYIREEWNYKEEPLMVVLDSNGKVTNSNALDMIKIWGAESFPFSASKEAELWQDQNLTMQLLLSDINPLLAYWVKEGNNLCIYGSENLAWIQQFNDNITQLKKTGLKLETIYVGNSQLSEQNIKEIITTATINLSVILSFTKLQFFWLRLESMRRSKLRQGKTPGSDYVLEELSALLDMNEKKQSWAVFGSGSLTNILRLQGEKVMEVLKKYHEWGENVHKLGLLGAIRNFLDPTFVAGPCSHFYIVPSSEELITEGSVICDMCMHPMKKFVVYQP